MTISYFFSLSLFLRCFCGSCNTTARLVAAATSRIMSGESSLLVPVLGASEPLCLPGLDKAAYAAFIAAVGRAVRLGLQVQGRFGLRAPASAVATSLVVRSR